MRLKLAFSLIVALITVFNVAVARNGNFLCLDATFEGKFIFDKTQLGIAEGVDIAFSDYFISPNGYFVMLVRLTNSSLAVYHYNNCNKTLEHKITAPINTNFADWSSRKYSYFYWKDENDDIYQDTLYVVDTSNIVWAIALNTSNNQYVAKNIYTGTTYTYIVRSTAKYYLDIDNIPGAIIYTSTSESTSTSSTKTLRKILYVAKNDTNITIKTCSPSGYSSVNTPLNPAIILPDGTTRIIFNSKATDAYIYNFDTCSSGASATFSSSIRYPSYIIVNINELYMLDYDGGYPNSFIARPFSNSITRVAVAPTSTSHSVVWFNNANYIHEIKTDGTVYLYTRPDLTKLTASYKLPSFIIKTKTEDSVMQYANGTLYYSYFFNSTHAGIIYRYVKALEINNVDEISYTTALFQSTSLVSYTETLGCGVVYGNNPFILLANAISCYFYQVGNIPDYSTSDIYVASVNNNGYHYKVYNLNTSLSYPVKFLLKNSPKACEKYVLRAERLYSDSYRYVKDALFDYSCYAIVNLEPQRFYRVSVIDVETNQIVFSTSGFKIAVSEYYINLDSPTSDGSGITEVKSYNYLNDYGQNIAYNCYKLGNYITCEANNLNTQEINVSFKVSRKLLVSDYTICEDNQKASSITFNCELDNSSKEVFVSLIWNVEDYNTTKVLFADYFQHIVQVVEDKSGILLAVMLYLGLALLGIFNPFVSIVLGLVALVISIKLNLIYLSISSIVGLAIILILIKVKEENV